MTVDQQNRKAALASSQDVIRVRIRECVEELGWTMTVLADRSGVARPTIYNFMSGSRPLGELSLTKIGKAMDVNPDWLTGSSNEKHAQAQAQQARETDLAEIAAVWPLLSAEDRVALIRTAMAMSRTRAPTSRKLKSA